jgi:CelD/BcsL family acetyltransferase involved in cellulose biosynthesis
MAEFYLRSLDDLRQPWNEILLSGSAPLFSSPGWAETWWKHFSRDDTLHAGAVEEAGRIIGIAPLKIQGGTLSFIGSDNLFDFQDFVIEKGHGEVFFRALLRHLKETEAAKLDLGLLLPDSSVHRWLVPLAREGGLDVSCLQEDVTISLDLPADAAAYLALLSGKQRHELLRKERRLNEEGDVSYRVHDRADDGDIDLFLEFFRESREDKNRFLTPPVELFMREIIQSGGAGGTLRLGILALNNRPIAATLCFEHRNGMYLYNSGYSPDYRWLSAGLLSKYYSILHSIEKRHKSYNFLKGAEKYKFHLGGKETGLFRCIINL